MKSDWTGIASELNYAVRNYDGITKQIVQITTRAHAYGIDSRNEELIYGKRDKKGNIKTKGLKYLKDVAARKMGNIIKDFPIWEEWLEYVPGIGPAIGGRLIRLYYFKSMPLCSKCDSDMPDIPRGEAKGRPWKCLKCNEEAKGLGLLKFRVALREFPTISGWWHFMGRANDDVTGKIPSRKKGKQLDYNPEGKKLGFDFKESINKFDSNHHYKSFAEKRKKYRMRTHPNTSQAHRHNMAWNESWKLFLSHFWQVDHILSGTEMTKPWIVQHGGHDESSIIQPYYFNGN